MDKAALGYGGAGTEPRQGDEGGERRPQEAAVVRLRQVADWDTAWAGGHMYIWEVR